MNKNDIGILRKYYLEKYETFQYQLLVIAGGTLTVFISINASSEVRIFYKYGFVLIGLSLFMGVLSSFFYQLHIILYAEVKDFLHDETERGGIDEKIALLNKIVSKGYSLNFSFTAGLIQLFLFLFGVVLITLGLVCF